MAIQKRVTILLTIEQYDRLVAMAGLVPVGTYIKSVLFEGGGHVRDETDADVRGVAGDTGDRRGRANPGRVQRPVSKQSGYDPTRPAYMDHDKTCQCGVCDFARKAGLKKP